MKLIISENTFKQLNENNLDRVQYHNELGEQWTNAVAVATTPPRISREFKNGVGKVFIIEITRIAIVPKGKADEYIQLIDFGNSAKTPQERNQLQTSSVDERAKMEIDSVMGFYSMGFTEKQAWYYFWQNWKNSYPNTRLVLEHYGINRM